MTDAHDQSITNHYIAHYPDHEPRESDPHYKDFNHYKKLHKATAKCAWGEEVNDFTECEGGLELHHRHVEFALMNGINLVHLEFAYPGISNPDEVGAWVESGVNLVFLCAKHHRRADAGIHHLSSADYEASKWVKGIFDKDPK